jgi:hypothetical protein
MDRRWFLALALLAVVGLVAHAATANGVVKSVDAAKKSAVVTVDGKDVTATWDEKTEVTVDGKKGGAADVKVGAKVTVTHEGGKASKIEVHTK